MPRLPSLLPMTLVLATGACGDEPFAPGTTFRLDAMMRAMYDCSSPASRDPLLGDRYGCGDRRDTLQGFWWHVFGTFSVTETLTETSQGDPVRTYVAEGGVDATACDPDCEQMAPGTTMVVDITRFPVTCGELVFPIVPHVCQGRHGERLNVIRVTFRDPPGFTLVAEDLGLTGDTRANYTDPFGLVRIAPSGPGSWLEIEWSLNPSNWQHEDHN